MCYAKPGLFGRCKRVSEPVEWLLHSSSWDTGHPAPTAALCHLSVEPSAFGFQRSGARSSQLCLGFDALELYMGWWWELILSLIHWDIRIWRSGVNPPVSAIWPVVFLLSHPFSTLLCFVGDSCFVAVYKCLLWLIPCKTSCISQGFQGRPLPISQKYHLLLPV